MCGSCPAEDNRGRIPAFSLFRQTVLFGILFFVLFPKIRPDPSAGFLAKAQIFVNDS